MRSENAETFTEEASLPVSKHHSDVSKWDVVSNVTDMRGMFSSDISKWDVSNVTDMRAMFNSDLSKWDVF